MCLSLYLFVSLTSVTCHLPVNLSILYRSVMYRFTCHLPFRESTHRLSSIDLALPISTEIEREEEMDLLQPIGLHDLGAGMSNVDRAVQQP